MKVRAKFKVDAIERSMGYGITGRTEDGEPIHGRREVHTIKMSPVYSSDENHENKKFWDASPGGSLELNCVNAEAVKQFQLDGEYYLDFVAAPAEAEAE